MSLDRPPVRGEYIGDIGHYRFRVPLQPSDPGWPLIVGDFLHNAHASLDYLITALIRSTGREEHDDSQFPIFTVSRKAGSSWLDVEQAWDDGTGGLGRKLRSTPAGTKDALKPLQPFFGGLRADPSRHALLVLDTLSNREKHRRLSVLARGAVVDFLSSDGERILPHGPPSQIARVAEPDATNVLTVAWETAKREGDVYLQAGYSVRLDEAPVIGDLVERLTSITEFIDGEVVPVVRDLL